MKPVHKASRIFPILLIIACLLASMNASGETSNDFHLVILHTNDFHGADYPALAREATLIKRIRSDEPNTLYLEAGDLFTRGPYQRKFFGALEFAVLNAVGCDALTLGNNEFKATNSAEPSRRYLAAQIAQANFPVLCANVKSENDARYLPKVQPYVIKNVGGLRIGIIGVTTERIINDPQLDGFAVEEPIKTVQYMLPKISTECDGILALTHIGFGLDCLLAARLPHLWAVVGGDSHTALETPYHNKKQNIPVVQAGESGHYLGRLDLILEKRDGYWVLKQYQGCLIPITKDIPEDPEIKALIQSFMDSLKKDAA